MLSERNTKTKGAEDEVTMFGVSDATCTCKPGQGVPE